MRITNLVHVSVAAAVAGVCLAAAAGCASLKLPSVPALFEREEPVVTPSSLAIVWTNAVLEQEGRPATRGFGGLVTFYGTDRKTPVRIDGQLTIYAYENPSREPGTAAPNRKYILTPEQLQKHYGKSTLGPSYSIWIPWDKAGGPRQEVGLVARFDPAEGGVVMSKLTQVAMLGPNPSTGRSAATEIATAAGTRPFVPERVRPATYIPDAGGDCPEPPARQMTTTTLNLPARRAR